MPAAAPPTLTAASSVPAGVAALVVALTPGDEVGVLGTRARAALEAFGVDVEAVVAVLTREKVKGGIGDIAALPVDSRLVLAAGFGEQTPRDFRRAGAAIVRRLKSVDSAAIVVGRAADAQLRALAEGLLLGGYAFKMTSATETPKPLSITIVVEQAEAPEALRVGVVTASATRLARDFANTPSSTKTPAWLAKQAVALGRTSGLEVRVRDARELREEGFGGIVAVGMGSANPPRLIELSYRPPASTAVAGHVVLVGKGITFDSGGLSLKPNAGMIAM
jgi:leucyl aminopeptidase